MMNSRIGSTHAFGRSLGALFLSAALTLPSLAQTVQPPASTTAATEPKRDVPVEVSDKPTGDPLTLSPFEVVADTKGYFSPNTMSGTRFNSKLDDLAASVSVLTKEQMADFAMLDINDAFLYVAGTEGTGTFSAITVDRNGSVSDGVQLDPQNANRIRGLSSANVSFNNYETMSRQNMDNTIINGLEVSRGPNANVFGLGNPSGTVNYVSASANLQRNRTTVSTRVDDLEGYRFTADHNQVLLKDKLALRVSAVNQHDGFVRKPSGVDTERYTGMVRYQPFKNTTITGLVSYYHQYGTRPNSTPPRDGISYWLSQGSPTWDPVTQQVHRNGVTVGTFPTNTGLPDYFNNAFTGSGRNYLYIDQNGIGYWTAPSGFSNTVPLAGATTAGPTSGAQAVRLMSPTAATGLTLGRSNVQPLFTTTPSVSNQALYDWTEVNLAAVNRDWDTLTMANAQLDQVFINTPRHLLVAQAGWLREDSNRFRRDYVGIANDNGQSGQLLIDVNERNIDGTANPYFLRPYIGQDQPRTTYQPAKWDTYRAQLAYRLDLTQEKGWIKYLGQHTLNGYHEYKYRINRRYSYREAMLNSNISWLPPGLSRGNQGGTVNPLTGVNAAAQNITRSYLRYYLGDNAGNNVDYAPTAFEEGTYDFVWGNTATNVFHRDPTLFGLAAVTDSTGGGSNSKVILKTNGGVIQSHFWGDRIVTTFGLREDEQRFQAGGTPTMLNADGITFNFDTIDHWNPNVRVLSGKTKQAGVVARLFRDTGFVNRMRQGTGAAHFFGDLLNGLSFTYNKSDSFIPQNPAVNLQQKEILNPTGEGTDYGIWLSMFDNRLVVRFNHYDTRLLNKSGGDAGTIAQRVTRIDLTANAAFLLVTQALGTTTTPGWIRAQNPGFTDAQLEAELAKQIGVPTELKNDLIEEFGAGTLSSTQDQQAKGNELEISFNPTRFWTVSVNGTDTQSINSNVSKDIKDWIDARMPIWTTIKDPRGVDHILGTPDDAPVNWWTTNYGGSQTPQQNYIAFVQTPFSVISQLEGKSNPQVSRYAARASTRYNLAGVSDNPYLKKMAVGGAWRWESKKAIGYYGVADSAGVYQSLDVNRLIIDEAHHYFDAFVSYKTSHWKNKVRATYQLNIRNIQESGHLQPISADPDGTPNTYRIVDPRTFILSATFDF